MIIRFVVDNLYSFGKEKEFNMLPRPKYRTLGQHKYNIADFEILKLSSIYGANGSGKSNLIKSLHQLQEIVRSEKPVSNLKRERFKFHKTEQPQVLAIEFFYGEQAFYYGIEIYNQIISTEELYCSGLGKNKDRLIFERKTDVDLKTTLRFSDEFESDKESQVLKTVIEKNLCKPDKSILKLLSSLDNPFLIATKSAFDWFDNSLQIILPNTKPGGLAHRMDMDAEFRKYANDIMCSFNIGINKIDSEKKTLKEFFGVEDSDEITELIKKVNDSPQKMVGLWSKKGEELILVEENDEYFIKQIKLEHIGDGEQIATFGLNEESDGTIRLLDFVPAFKEIISSDKVIVVDEIERSIHPMMIKKLIEKFSLDEKSRGQLIFSTHESNLLDQSIFRQDEIWFTEKDKCGCTDLYSLSDYKEHNTIDIRKGYLNGRYGAIPFLGNLEDLNWHKYDSKE